MISAPPVASFEEAPVPPERLIRVSVPEIPPFSAPKHENRETSGRRGCVCELVQLRQKCQTTLLSLSDEQARRQVAFPWRWWKPMSFFELQLYTLRHVQEHVAQLSLFLGQRGIPGEALDWVG